MDGGSSRDPLWVRQQLGPGGPYYFSLSRLQDQGIADPTLAALVGWAPPLRPPPPRSGPAGCAPGSPADGPGPSSRRGQGARRGACCWGSSCFLVCEEGRLHGGLFRAHLKHGLGFATYTDPGVATGSGARGAVGDPAVPPSLWCTRPLIPTGEPRFRLPRSEGSAPERWPSANDLLDHGSRRIAGGEGLQRPGHTRFAQLGYGCRKPVRGLKGESPGHRHVELCGRTTIAKELADLAQLPRIWAP
jgi:hypothetical protein